jgi:hypothetical protein
MATAEQQKAICDQIVNQSDQTPFQGVETGLDQLHWKQPIEHIDAAIGAFERQKTLGNEVPTGKIIKHVEDNVLPPTKKLATGTSSPNLAAAVGQYTVMGPTNMNDVRREINGRNEFIDTRILALRAIKESLTPQRVDRARAHVAAARINRTNGNGNVMEYRSTL